MNSDAYGTLIQTGFIGKNLEFLFWKKSEEEVIQTITCSFDNKAFDNSTFISGYKVVAKTKIYTTQTIPPTNYCLVDSCSVDEVYTQSTPLKERSEFKELIVIETSEGISPIIYS